MERPLAACALVSLSLLPLGCFNLAAAAEAECFPGVTVGEDSDDEDVAEALALVTCLDGDFIVDNTLVERLSLPDLTDITGSFGVALNVSLTAIELPALERVGGVVDLSGNLVLEEVSLPSLRYVGGGLRMVSNPRLPPCEAEAVAAGIEQLDGPVVLEGNTGEGCP